MRNILLQKPANKAIKKHEFLRYVNPRDLGIVAAPRDIAPQPLTDRANEHQRRANHKEPRPIILPSIGEKHKAAHQKQKIPQNPKAYMHPLIIFKKQGEEGMERIKYMFHNEELPHPNT